MDVVGILGDTPVLNSLLCVSGHTDDACCHKCALNCGKRELLQNNYLSSNIGCLSAPLRRTSLRHLSTRAILFSESRLQDLGLRRKPTDLNNVFVQWREATCEKTASIPKTTEGILDVPPQFNPYTACQIAINIC